MISITTILNDLMGAAIVLAALIALAVVIKLIASAAGKSKEPDDAGHAGETAAAPPAFIQGELKLIDVDEKTAAAIMAIVSHESGIPLYELRFNSIKLV